jgi:hypothetical protein
MAMASVPQAATMISRSMQGIGALGRLLCVHGSHPPWPRVPFRPPNRKVDLVDIALIVVPVLVMIFAFLLASTL